LTGWRIDVCSEAEAEEETRRTRQSISAIPGIGDIAAELLYQAGFKSAEDVAQSELEEIMDVEGISKEKAESLHRSAKEHVEEKQRKEAEAAVLKAAEIAAAQQPEPSAALADEATSKGA
jgi:N utilization substance protein A